MQQASWLIHAVNSSYYRDDATSDTVLQRFGRLQRAVPRTSGVQEGSLAVGVHAFAGMGRWRTARRIADSLRTLDPEKAIEVQALAIALGLAPASAGGFLDSAVTAFPPGAEAEYGHALLHMLRGQVREGRRRIARALAARDSGKIPTNVRGLLIAADGWGMVLQGDSAAGIARLRSGLDQVAAPGMAEESAFLRFQLALALAARPESREEGIRWLKYGFDLQPLYLPLTNLALGRTYEAAGQRDSAGRAYSRFLRLWDKADPELQGRVREAKEAIQEISGERPGS
jgi:hypothetical protein